MDRVAEPSGNGLLSPVDGKPHQFLTLDGLRGVAAVAVIAFHGGAALKPIRFPSGYLAVDFFFMLSGFVLTYAYGAKLDAGWSTWTYFKTRIVRLYPLYLVGLALGLVYLAVLSFFRDQSLFTAHFLYALLLGLLILPVMSTHPFSKTTAFPLNYPSWSIFFELAINMVQALFLRRCSTRILAGVAGVSLAVMLLYTRWTGTINLGLNSPENLLCLFRVLFSYVVGILLFRVWKSHRLKLKLSPALIAVVLAGALALPVGRHLVAQEMLVILAVFPVLILLAANVEPGPRWRPWFRLLGQTSYAVYILHAPLLSMVEELWLAVRHTTPEQAAPWIGLLFIACLLFLAVLVDRFYDLPMRTFLRNRLLPRKAAG